MTTADENAPTPEWDAVHGRWTANGHAWDDAVQRWVPLDTAGAPVAPEQRAQRPFPHARASEHEEQPGSSRSRRLGTGAVLAMSFGGVGVTAVVALVIGLAVLPRVMHRPEPASTASAASAASAAVRTFLEAVADADADAATAQLTRVPADTTLLTDAVLEKSRHLAPIGDIEVGEATVTSYTAEVPVTYTIGDIAQRTSFRADSFAQDGTWRVSGIGDIGLPMKANGLSLVINGQPVTAESTPVFPGTYEISTTTPMFVLGGTTTTALRTLDDWPSFSAVEVQLDAEGLERFQSAVTDAVSACVTSTALQAGCGLDVPATLSDGTKVIDGTVKRTLGGEAATRLAHLEPQPSYASPTQIRTVRIGDVDLSADCEVDGLRMPGCRFTVNPYLGAAIVDFAVDPPLVRWE